MTKFIMSKCYTKSQSEIIIIGTAYTNLENMTFMIFLICTLYGL